MSGNASHVASDGIASHALHNVALCDRDATYVVASLAVVHRNTIAYHVETTSRYRMFLRSVWLP